MEGLAALAGRPGPEAIPLGGCNDDEKQNADDRGARSSASVCAGRTRAAATRASAGKTRAATAPRPVSPEIHPDRTVTFRLAAPKAAEVTLNGSWEGARNIAMTKGENGVWSVTVGPLSPQLWGYWFLVDGVKALDPGNGETQRDGSRIDNLLMISGPESDLWDFKDVPHGTIHIVWYPSPTLKEARRRMYVYTPPGLRSQPEPLPRAVPAPRRRRR